MPLAYRDDMVSVDFTTTIPESDFRYTHPRETPADGWHAQYPGHKAKIVAKG